MKKILALFLSLAMAVTLVIPALAEENHVTQAQIKSSIEDIINFRKGENDKIITEDILSNIMTSGTNWLIIGLARNGYEEDYDAYISALKAAVEDKYNSDPDNKLGQPTDFAKVILTAGAVGYDATNFGKDSSGKSINLLSDGIYNNEKLETQGLNGLVYGLLALDSKDYEIPEGALYTRESIISKILSNQTSDGGFAYFGDDADPDMTAMTLQALAKYYYDEKTYTYDYKGESVTKSVKEVFDQGLSALSNIQNSQGGFTSWGYTSSASAAQVILAVSSVGIDVQKYEPLIKNGNSLMDFLMTFKCADGGFANTVASGEKPQSNAMITDQILYTLVGYERMINGQRNLYDYNEETDKTKFVIECDGNEYILSFNDQTSEYNLELPLNAKNIKFKNIPSNSYDKINIGLNEEVEIKDSIDLNFVSRTGDIRNYKINISLSDKAAVKSIIDKINSLPSKISLDDKDNIEKLLSEYNSLSSSDKEKVTNIEKLNLAKTELDKLLEEQKTETEKQQNEIKSEIEKLYKEYTVNDLAKISVLSDKLSKMEDFGDKKALEEKLLFMKNEIETKIKKAQDLNERIWNEIDPMNITLKDKEKILAFEKEYNELDEDVRDKVTNYQDIIDAKKVIEELEKQALNSESEENNKNNVSNEQETSSQSETVNTGDNMNFAFIFSLMIISLFGTAYFKKVK